MPEIFNMSIKKLTLLEKNPRKIDKDQFAKLVKSLEYDPDFFTARPCLVNHIVATGQMIVYAGNQRVLAAKKLKWKEVPCIIDLDLDEDKMKSRIIKDNAHFGTWNWEELGNCWDVDILLNSGLTLSELHIDLPDLTTEEKKEEDKGKNKKECPNCGYVSS